MSLFGAIGGIVGTVAGGPLGAAIGSKAGDTVGGLFGGGHKKQPGIEDMMKLLTGGTIGGGGISLGGGVNPHLAETALGLFSKAQTPEQKSKLLDIAIKALGGEPGQPPSSMNAQNAPTPGVEHGASHTLAHNAECCDHAPAPTAASTPSAAASASSASGSSSSGGLSVNGNTVDTGRYTVSASNDKDGDVKVFDKQTNSFVEAFGDPHVATSGGDKAAFHKNGLSIMLPDGTNVSLKPTPTNDKGVAWLQGALVEKNGQAVTMSGMHGGTVQTSQVQPDSQELRSQYLTQGQTVLSADNSDVGKLYLTDATGQRTTQLSSKDHETLLDGDGGAMIQNGTANAASAPKGSALPWNPDQMEKMSQVMHLSAANVHNPTDQKAIAQSLQSMLDEMMNPKIDE